MKILNISFKNINSLRGEHKVEFNTSPLSDAGIFAITGPTGSGKSTLLDVITLSLFNQIPRLKKKISKSELESIGGVITRHTKEAFASIEYAVGNKKYTSTWSISRGRKDQLRDYEMFIYDASGKALDLKKSEVPSYNEQIIGLSYNQFIQSIILSQGEFSKFIKAGKNERGQLLEKITGTGIYRKLSRACFEKHKTLKTIIAQEKQLLEDIQLLDVETVAILKEEQVQLQKHKKTYSESIQELQKLIQLKEELTNNDLKIEEYTSQLKALDLQKKASSQHQQALLKHEQLTPLIPDITKLDEANKLKLTTSKSYDIATKQLAQWQQNLQTALDKMSLLLNKAVNAQNFNELMSQFETEVGNMDRDLLNLKQQGIGLRSEINQTLKEGKLGLHPDIHPSEALIKLSEIRTAIDEVIDKNQALSKMDTSAILHKLEEELNQIKQLQEIQQLQENAIKNNNQSEEINKKLTQTKDMQSSNLELLKTSKELQKSLEQEYELLVKQKEDALKIANLETYRKKLQDGEPCPLCGSLEHPYSSHLESVDLGAQDQQLLSNSKKQKEHQLKLETIQKNAHQYEHNINQYEREIEQINALNKSITKEINTLRDHLAVPIKLSATSIKNELVQLEKNVADKKAVVAIKQQADEIKLVKSQFEKLGSILERFTTLNKKRKEKYQGKDAKDECNIIQNEYVKAQTQMAGISAEINKDKQALQQLSLQIDDLNATLKPALSKLDYDDYHDAKHAILSDAKVQEIKAQQASIQQKEIELKAGIKQYEARNNELRALDNKADIGLEELIKTHKETMLKLDETSNKQGVISEKLTNDEKERKRYANKEKQVIKLKEAFDVWSQMNQMIGDAQGNKFANFAQGLTLKNLMVYANRRLQHLSDRYLLDPARSEDSLMVIDQYQGNIQRAVSTLSGGEVFILSLALALSLSDMASKNVSLESLFIDEGFGTLDHETLDIAMNTLEKLQSESQKTVGVISHVAALKERINVQIQMKKNAQGYSVIELKS